MLRRAVQGQNWSSQSSCQHYCLRPVPSTCPTAEYPVSGMQNTRLAETTLGLIYSCSWQHFPSPNSAFSPAAHTGWTRRLYKGGRLVTMFGSLCQWLLHVFIKRENLKGLIFYLHHPASAFTVSIVMPVSIRLKISLATWYFLPEQVFCTLIKLPPHLPSDSKLSSKEAKLCWWGLFCSSQNCSGSFWSPSPFP